MNSQALPIEPGQESVWQYPRPPRLEAVDRPIQIVVNGQTIVDTVKAFRVLETSHPPVYYLPPSDIQMQYLQITNRTSFCEWKGNAVYYDLSLGDRQIQNVAWAYPNPTEKFNLIKDHLAFYAQLVEACYVNGELVTPQPGGFYGGWITKNIVGPFKGSPGSWGW